MIPAYHSLDGGKLLFFRQDNDDLRAAVVALKVKIGNLLAHEVKEGLHTQPFEGENYTKE